MSEGPTKPDAGSLGPKACRYMEQTRIRVHLKLSASASSHPTIIFAGLSVPDMAQRRLTRLLSELAQPPPPIGTLTLGGIALDIHAAQDPARLPHAGDALLDTRDTFTADNLHFILQKYLLGQDVFLLSQPGPYARRLAMTFCR